MECTHFDELGPVTRKSRGCEECEAMGDTWIHLRACLVCGKVGCCDSSKNKHASKHYLETGHAVIRSLEPLEHWGWCFVDKVMVDLM